MQFIIKDATVHLKYTQMIIGFFKKLWTLPMMQLQTVKMITFNMRSKNNYNWTQDLWDIGLYLNILKTRAIIQTLPIHTPAQTVAVMQLKTVC